MVGFAINPKGNIYVKSSNNFVFHNSVASGNQALPWDHEQSISWTHMWEIVM